jgi:hypothetical protein
MKTGDPVDIQLNMLRRRAKTEHCEYYYLDALNEIEFLETRVQELEARISAYEEDDPYLCMRYQPSESSEEI